MILPLGKGADEFMELKLKPGSWEARGIPEQGVRVRSSWFEKVVAQGGGYAIDDLIYGLMDWLDVTDDPEPALKTLRRILDHHYPPDTRADGRCCFRPEQGGDLIFHAASTIDQGKPLVAWQRRQWVIALGAPSDKEPGRLVVAAPAAISLRVAQSIMGHSITSFMMEPFDSIEGARATSGRTGSYYSWEAGEATIVSWDNGLGIAGEPGGDELIIMPAAVDWLPVRQLAMQVAIAAGYAG